MARTNKKADQRLDDRVADFYSIPGKEYLAAQGLKMHKPGSENRKK